MQCVSAYYLLNYICEVLLLYTLWRHLHGRPVAYKIVVWTAEFFTEESFFNRIASKVCSRVDATASAGAYIGSRLTLVGQILSSLSFLLPFLFNPLSFLLPPLKRSPP